MQGAISYKQVEESANEIHRLAISMSETMKHVENTCKTLVDTEGWSGKAADFFLGKVVKMNNEFQVEAYAEMENLVLYLAQVTEGYKVLGESLVKEICQNLGMSEPNLSSSTIFGGDQ